MPEPKQSGGGLSLQTLLISACAAVAAATVVPLFWRAGTLVATAMTPVIVALVSEALRKPVERVSAVAPRVAPRVARRTGTGAAVRRFDPDAARPRDYAQVGARGRGPERFEPLPPHEDAPAVRSDDPFGLRAAERRRPRLKIALLTGLAAFLIAAAAVTASELAIFGGSVSGQGGRTSLFGGKTTHKAQTEKTATPTATPGEQATPQATATATATPGAATSTPTPTPSATATPAPSAAASPAPTP